MIVLWVQCCCLSSTYVLSLALWSRWFEYLEAHLHWGKMWVLHNEKQKSWMLRVFEDSDTLSSVSFSSVASGTLCGGELTNSQIEDPYFPLSTQQTTYFLDADHACNSQLSIPNMKQCWHRLTTRKYMYLCHFHVWRVLLNAVAVCFSLNLWHELYVFTMIFMRLLSCQLETSSRSQVSDFVWGFYTRKVLIKDAHIKARIFMKSLT